ncbi:ScbA/BarX family gamma-butyrolactone biosynthesis protein [Streptomyces sp. NPDC049813]|uniref:ScbA/BarX family gamma-butyrolactone biosynthesis protein n=1 Tax=Streptomyces sp. NPDC049813 TaxID=3365597 RepID=UPI00378FED33
MSVHTVSGTSSAHTTTHTAPHTMRAASPAQLGAFLNLPLTTTVPKEFVHRVSVAEVFLTGWARQEDDRFLVTGQWPRVHSFFTPVDGRHDPLLAAETLRQAGMLVAHAEFGIPLGHRFLMWDLALSVDPAQLTVGAAPATIEIEVSCRDVKRRRDVVTGFRCDVVIRRDGRTAATGSSSFTSMTPSVYGRLRGERERDPRILPLTAPTAPQTVGRTSPMDVVLSPVGRPDVWQLRVDTRHPVLFEHPVDHVPGMALLEAARQAASAHLGRSCQLLAITSEFENYAELDAPCLIGIEPAPGPATPGQERLLVTCRQNDRSVFRATVTVAGPES